MYIDNPKKLFDDLSKISTLSECMVDIAHIGKEENLEELITIVFDNKDALWDSRKECFEGSILWDLGEECDEAPNPKECRAQLRKDSRKLKKIWATLQKEAAEKGYKDRWGHL